MNIKRIFIIILIIGFLITTATALTIRSTYKEIQEGKIPKYEVGEQRRAAACIHCHTDIYNQWSKHSSHATSTTNENFLDFKEKLENNKALNAVFGVEYCHSCAGSNEEGVNCEVCHGVMPQDWSFQETHEKKFKPQMEEIRKQDFCPKCHEIEELMTTYADWQKSEAAKKGITCQECHMKPRGSDIAYHGFDSTSRSLDASKYSDVLSVKDIEYDFPRFSLAVENSITGHAVPAVGPSRLLVLEVSFQDSEGDEEYRIVEKFTKHTELIPVVGLFPAKVTENSQLQSLEKRPLSYTLPSSLRGKLSKAVVTLRFYDVSDDHTGDLAWAHWISDPIIEEEVSL